ncbi:hypothetical protein NC796_21975 [Aliifodinibius sp. S!AR15-10]|uniref:lanthionine synthetase LanC family protein n=1 Tax=Aliifodinibius sp. S!AR15-10 TaxID=2950437 RepID=UPI00285807ED|nr:lanthionine synthetase LanC family protein [Aliifodinibius sp. S!AR15-10]MDR8393837.1 hypothetical protein [Aliifodinibius sp. S!AR15-10]
MGLILEKIEYINNLLLEQLPEIKNTGLLKGKMGISLYFYHLSRATRSEDHRQQADAILDEVYEQVSSGGATMDFQNGLAGIAWAIEHLVQQQFVEADTDQILKDVDNKIYKRLASSSKIPLGILNGRLGYMLYIFSRLQGRDQPIDSSYNYILKKLLIDQVNHVGQMVEERKIDILPTTAFDITWDLPACLAVLGRARALDFYNTKIDMILKQLSPVLLSLYPHALSNRLYLLFGMERVLNEVEIPGWRSHANFLKTDLQPDYILESEMNDKHLILSNGVAGIALINRRLFRLTGDKSLRFDQEALIQKITTSEYWELLEKIDLETVNIGMLNGLTGIGLQLVECLKTQKKSAETVI